MTCENQVKGIDSLVTLLKTPVPKIDLHQMYRLTMTHINTLISFSPDEITITQLKNSSEMRLIGNKQVSDSIIGYYSTFESHVEQQKFMMNFLQETLLLEIAAMDFGAMTNKKPTYTFDQRRYKEFFNRTLLFQSLMENEIGWMKDYQKQSISLLKLLKKEYKLE
ncbi:MAG TPA: hypothetical protein PKH79_08975 [Prolixibacteraceae bacterium]|nr:hypothetical protein [Prolixibacteraceae bacterium]